MSMVIRTDGTVEEIGDALGLEELQVAVGGYIEFVYIQHDNECLTMAVNEEGLLLGLPVNHTASILANRYIVGDVVIGVSDE